MAIVGVVGGQWGDEGKGKVIDLLAQRAELVIRSHGGNNAGHTVLNEQGKFALHLVPAGIFNASTTCIVGPGVVLDPAILLEELDGLNQRGVDTSGLMISSRAHMVMPYHRLLDRLQEESRGAGRIGTTGRGIGPAYADKTSRDGLRVGELLDLDSFRVRLEQTLAQKNRLLERVYEAAPFDVEAMYADFSGYAAQLRPYIKDTEPVVFDAVRSGKNILLEGAHGTMLDTDHGTYPYVTSSSSTVAGLCLGGGIGPTKLDVAVGVFKAYSTRVGGGPMPTELKDAVGDHLRDRGYEFGTTTGRPRRCGWFDAVAAKHSVMVNGFNSLAITKLDVLDDFSELKICVAYKLDGEVIDFVPADAGQLDRCVPVFETLAGWNCPLSSARGFKDLPAAAASYLDRIERLLEVEIDVVGVGAAREAVICRRDLY
ncbi:MAG TPA: adenylosuccinate synthase [Chloroflexota bacterium]|nr:adenylosuccinate synthase [Chloroflexota bacterium]